MRRWRDLAILAACGLVSVGCFFGTATPPAPQPEPSAFYNFFTNEIVAAEFDEKFAEKDPANGVRNEQARLTVEQSFAYRSTVEECNRMLEKLLARVKTLARDQNCTISELESEPSPVVKGLVDGFSLKYAGADYNGTVEVDIVVVEPPTDKDKAMRYKVELTVTENVREQTPAPK